MLRELMDQHSSRPPTPVTISHYRLIEPLGVGAMGEVWLAEDTQLPRRVAVKLLPWHLAQDPDAVERLLREARAAASVDHPGVVAVYEAGLAEGRPYLVMQRVEGPTLEERLASGPLSHSEALALGIQVADALAEVHALGIVHRDLKPANVILTARGAKILDFGVASVKDAPGLTSTGTAIGTPEAMSPEQIKGLPSDNRSDLWALGVLLYRSLTGRAPFSGEAFEAVAYQILHEQPPPPSTLRPELGSELDFTVMKLLRKDPAMRYARAEDVLADIKCCHAASAGSELALEAAAPPAPRLAVLYFEVLSASADDAFLAAGLTEDLIVDLTRISGLRVASRAEVMPFRDRVAPPRTLARELSADYLLLGSVRRAGNRARISAQLVRASDGHALWADRFDRTLEDIFEVQAEVSNRIVEALQVALRPGEREMLGRAPTRNAEAYSLYLRAREILDIDRDSNRRAEVFLRSALELDEHFALAHATLGETIVRRGMRWWGGPEVADQAIPHAARALALEPDLVDAHLVLAMVHRLKGEPDKLLSAIERVMELDPDHPEALEYAGWSYLALGHPEEALRFLERVAERHADHYLATAFLASCYTLLGRDADAERTERLAMERVVEAVRRNPDNAHARTILGISLVRQGQVAAGIEQCERAVAIVPNDGRIHYNFACALAIAGEAERAITELTNAAAENLSYIADWPARDPDLASLRDHPEFIRLFGTASESADVFRSSKKP